jgi:hypothetical protein
MAEVVCASEVVGLFGAANDAGTEVAVCGVAGKATDGAGVKVIAAGGVGFGGGIGAGGVDVVNAADEAGFPDAWGDRGDAASEAGFKMPQVKLALPLL